MDSRHEKLLEEFEDFEADLEVEDILKKVKEELVLDQGVIAFGEKLKERERLKQIAQATRTARATRFHQLCYPQLTCDWFVEGLDYCCGYWRYQFKRPLTPPPAPPPSPDASCKTCPTMLPLHLPPHQTPHHHHHHHHDVDFDKDELTKLRAKEERRLARRRAASARYRARHPDRVAASKQRYRAKRRKTNPVSFDDYDDDDDDDVCGVYDELAELHAKEARRRAQLRAASARYRARHPDRVSGYQKQYYETHSEQLRAYQRQRRQSEAGQRWNAQFRARKRESAALLARQRGSMERQRTAEKVQALGPLTLTVTLEDFMRDFDDSLASTPKDSMDQPCAMTITDMDSGDHVVCDESSLSSCDMWDDGSSFWTIY